METTTRPLTLTWGLQPPPTTPLAWGARAIYSLLNRASIDLLWDRQSTARDEAQTTEQDAAALGMWINNIGLPQLRKLCIEKTLTGDCDNEVEFASDGYALKASPRASYGYLYIVAWVTL